MGSESNIIPFDDHDADAPLIKSKSALAKARSKRPRETTVGTSDEQALPLPPRKPITEKQHEQRKRAAQTRVTKMAQFKRKKDMLETVSRLFDEDEEGFMRRLNPSETRTVVQDVVQEEPLEATPAAQELPKESGITEAEEINYTDQAYDQNETQKVMGNDRVLAYDRMPVRSLYTRQMISPVIYNSVQSTAQEQGIVMLPLPTYHRSG